MFSGWSQSLDGGINNLRERQWTRSPPVSAPGLADGRAYEGSFAKFESQLRSADPMDKVGIAHECAAHHSSHIAPFARLGGQSAEIDGPHRFVTNRADSCRALDRDQIVLPEDAASPVLTGEVCTSLDGRRL